MSVKDVEKNLTILKAIKEGDSISVGEIASKCGLKKDTLYKKVRSLVNKGILIRHDVKNIAPGGIQFTNSLSEASNGHLIEIYKRLNINPSVSMDIDEIIEDFGYELPGIFQEVGVSASSDKLKRLYEKICNYWKDNFNEMF